MVGGRVCFLIRGGVRDVNGTNKPPGSVCSPLVKKFDFRVRRKFLMSEFSNRLLKLSPIDLQSLCIEIFKCLLRSKVYSARDGR